ncbi:hypothetical protein GCM10027605_49650 [Micromonospora zhanjiangensis]
MTRSNTLGEYLRARRELRDPAAVGLRVTGVRRTPGLRREEVATLAGISADYYLRLEQGRDRNPSPQVLSALARVFGLDATAIEYLLGLTAGQRATPARQSAPRAAPQVVPAGIRQLLDVLDLPAFVENRTFDVLAANRLATALSPAIRPGLNRLRSLLLDEAEREMTLDWERTIGGLVAAARSSIGAAVDDPGSPAWSTNWRRPANRSGGSGHGTTSSRSPAPRCGCGTRWSVRWRCGWRSCRSATPAVNSW